MAGGGHPSGRAPARRHRFRALPERQPGAAVLRLPARNERVRPHGGVRGAPAWMDGARAEPPAVAPHGRPYWFPLLRPPAGRRQPVRAGGRGVPVTIRSPAPFDLTEAPRTTPSPPHVHAGIYSPAPRQSSLI